MQSGFHRLIGSQIEMLPYTSTKRTDATAWFDAEHYTSMRESGATGLFGDWRLGRWWRVNSLITSDGQWDSSAALYAVANRRAIDVWFGLRRDWRNGHPMYAGFYFSLVLAAYLLVCLSSLDRERLPTRLVQVDRLLGNLSYSVFLCHWLVALMTTWIFFDATPTGDSTLFWSSLAGVNALAYLIHIAIERPVERMRNAVRPAGSLAGR